MKEEINQFECPMPIELPPISECTEYVPNSESFKFYIKTRCVIDSYGRFIGFYEATDVANQLRITRDPNVFVMGFDDNGEPLLLDNRHKSNDMLVSHEEPFVNYMIVREQDYNELVEQSY